MTRKVSAAKSNITSKFSLWVVDFFDLLAEGFTVLGASFLAVRDFETTGLVTTFALTDDGFVF
jgi:hypothetical protein